MSKQDLYEDIFSRLKGLAQAEPGQKYNVKTKTYSEGDSWWTAGERIWYGEGRQTLIDELEELQTLINSHRQNIYFLYGQNYKYYYKSVNLALRNLLVTYEEDEDMINNLNRYITFFDMELATIKNMLVEDQQGSNIESDGEDKSDQVNESERGSLLSDQVDKPEQGSLLFDQVDKPEQGSLLFDQVDKPEQGSLLFDQVDKPEQESLLFDQVDKPEQESLLFDQVYPPDQGAPSPDSDLIKGKIYTSPTVEQNKTDQMIKDMVTNINTGVKGVVDDIRNINNHEDDNIPNNDLTISTKLVMLNDLRERSKLASGESLGKDRIEEQSKERSKDRREEHGEDRNEDERRKARQERRERRERKKKEMYREEGKPRKKVEKKSIQQQTGSQSPLNRLDKMIDETLDRFGRTLRGLLT